MPPFYLGPISQSATLSYFSTIQMQKLFALFLFFMRIQTSRSFLIQCGNRSPSSSVASPHSHLPSTPANRWQEDTFIIACEGCHVRRPSWHSARRLRACPPRPRCQRPWACQLLHIHHAAACRCCSFAE